MFAVVLLCFYAPWDAGAVVGAVALPIPAGHACLVMHDQRRVDHTHPGLTSPLHPFYAQAKILARDYVSGVVGTLAW